MKKRRESVGGEKHRREGEKEGRTDSTIIWHSNHPLHLWGEPTHEGKLHLSPRAELRVLNNLKTKGSFKSIK